MWRKATQQNLLAVALCFCALIAEAPARTIYVDGDATGADNGMGWAHAYVSLQDALAAANSGDEIRVAQGVYRPDDGTRFRPGDSTASFGLISGVTITGGYAGFGEPDPDVRDIATHKTLLSGDLAGNDTPQTDPRQLAADTHRSENGYHVVTAIDVTRAVLDGFHIAGGYANGHPESFKNTGAGVYVEESNDVTLRDCTIADNVASYHGGGLYVRQKSLTGSVTLVNCRLHANAAVEGGGLFLHYATNVHLIGTSVTGNWAERGGGLAAMGADALLANCVWSGNSADHWGGALVIGFSKLQLVNCLITGNTAPLGGAIITGNSNDMVIVNCTLAGNRAACGEAVLCSARRGCIIEGYPWPVPATRGPFPSTVHVANSILWNTGDEIVLEDESAVDVANSNVRAGYPGPGNSDVDPWFALEGSWDDNGTSDDPNDDAWLAGDYRLQMESPCIDRGSSAAVPPDAADLDNDGDTTEPVPVDLTGHPRFTRRPGITEFIAARPGVDMGAYEFCEPQPVYRFWAPRDQRHFYTISPTERDKLVDRYAHVWTYEGVAYHAFADDGNPGVVPVYRMWSARLRGHFYTISETERDKLIEGFAETWTDEGVAFYVCRDQGDPVWRFWSASLQAHFYTINPAERDKLIEHYAETWTYEGVAWGSFAYPD